VKKLYDMPGGEQGQEFRLGEGIKRTRGRLGGTRGIMLKNKKIRRKIKEKKEKIPTRP